MGAEAWTEIRPVDDIFSHNAVPCVHKVKCHFCKVTRTPLLLTRECKTRTPCHAHSEKSESELTWTVLLVQKWLTLCKLGHSVPSFKLNNYGKHGKERAKAWSIAQWASAFKYSSCAPGKKTSNGLCYSLCILHILFSIHGRSFLGAWGLWAAVSKN